MSSIWPPPPEDFPPKGGLPTTPPGGYPPPSGYPPPGYAPPRPGPGPGGYPPPDAGSAQAGPSPANTAPGTYPPPDPYPQGYLPPGYPTPSPTPYAPEPSRLPPGPPPRHPKPRIWTWLLLALAVVFVLIAGCTAVGIRLAKGPIDAANQYVALLDSGQVPAAYQSLCASTRATKTLAQFTADNSAASRITDYVLSSVSTGTSQSTQVSGTVSIDGNPRSVAFQMAKENGAWRVCVYPALQ